MTDARIVRVFISSPSDVRPERGIAARVVQRLAREFSYHFKVEAVLWEREPMLASHQFQELIVEPHQTDIVVVLLWSRLGMPLPDEARWKGRLSGRQVTGTEWEFEDALASHRERQLPDLLLYRKRADVTVKLGDRAAYEEQQRQAELVDDFMGRWFRDAEGKSATAASRSFAGGGEFEQMLEANLRDLLRRRLAGEAGAQEPTTIRWHQGSPYRGLEAFGPEHEPIFFGRTRERNEVRELLARQVAGGRAFVLVMGASGSGKSSLVKAAVLPDLCEAGMVGHAALVRHAFTRPGVAGDAVSGLAAALLEPTALPELTAAPLEYTAEHLASLLRKAPDEAAQPIRQGLSAAGRTARLTGQGEARLLLVVDQLEELFTSEAITAEARERYVAALQALASSGLVWVIATMRSDFFDRLEQLPALAALAAGEAKYLLTAPGGAEIEQIIRQPAREAGLRFEVDAESGRSLDDVIREAAATEAGSLPLLEYLLDQLWHRREGNGLLTHAAYRDLGGLEGAIGRRAEAVLASQAPAVQGALPRLLRALVTVRPGVRGAVTARYAHLGQLSEGGAERRLVAALLDPQARLLVADGETLRVAHEALLTHWPRAQAQIAEDRSDLQMRARLEEQATRWEAATGKDRNSLLLAAGLPLSEAEDLLRRRREELDRGLINYIETSTTAILAQQRKTTRRLQAIAATLAILAVGAAIGAWFGFTGQQRAQQQAEVARTQETRAISILGRQSIASGDAQSGMLAAMAILPQSKSDLSRPWSPDATMALYEGWLHNREVMTLIGPRGWVYSAAFGPGGRRVVTASENGTARLWDISVERPTALVLEGHTDRVKSAAFSPDGRLIMTASDDGTARLWNVSGERPTTSFDLRGHQGGITSAAFSPDGRRVVTTSYDGRVGLWNIRGDRPPAIVLERQKDVIRSAAFSSDGGRVVTASDDGTARVWDITGERPTELVLAGHTKAVVHAVFSPDGRRVVTASDDGTARLWDITGERPTALVLDGHKRPVTRAAFSPDGRRVITASDDGTARLWDVGGERPTALILDGHKDKITNAIFSPDGRRVVTASYDGTARLWDITGERPSVVILEGHEGAVRSAAFSPDGRRVLTTSSDGTARLWDITGERPSALLLEGHKGPVRSAAFSPDGRRVVTASADGTARLWDITGERPTALLLEGHKDKVVSAAFSPDGRRVVTTSEDRTARLWDISGGRPNSLVLEGYKGWVLSAAFSPDGRRVVTVSDGDAARLWDISGERPTALVLEGHKGWVESAAFSPDGRRLLTVSGDTLSLWSISGERPIAVVLQAHESSITSAAFSPDGRRLLTASIDGTARVWPSPDDDELVVLARKALTRCLSPSQRDGFGLAPSSRPSTNRDEITAPPCN